jgi:hypothetical protein
VVRRQEAPTAPEAATQERSLFEPTTNDFPEADERDWSLDDDAADYSAAV